MRTDEPLDALNISVVLAGDAQMPAYQTHGSAGMDLCCSEGFSLAPMERRLVGTGVSIAIPVGFEGQTRPRSGLAARQGISLVNAPGTIDSDYRGEIRLIMINLGESVVTFNKGDRVAQLVICPVTRAELTCVEALPPTHRGEAGFGSTGV